MQEVLSSGGLVNFVMEFLKTALSGMIATTGMSLTMWFITRSKIAEADMIRALGSLVTKKKNNAFQVGLLIHFVSGVAFAIPYSLVLDILNIERVLISTLSGAVLGFFHGFIVSFMLVAFVAQNHPLEEFREPGLSIAASHIAGHIVYGLLVGCMYILLGVQYGIKLVPEN